MPTNLSLVDMCRDRCTVFRELTIVKPMDKLAKLGNYWLDLGVLSSIEKLVKGFERDFLSNHGCTQIVRLDVSLS